MVTVPAVVWRGGPLSRGVTLGVCVGVFFGVLAWLDSGMPVAGATVFVIVGAGAGVWMSRRMVTYWPGSRALTAAQRAAVVSAARRGELGDEALGPAVIDYSRGLHAAAQQGRPLRPVIVVVLLAAVAMALWDAVHGSPGNVMVSVIYVICLALELFWWPQRIDQLLANADRAAMQARPVDSD